MSAQPIASLKDRQVVVGLIDALLGSAGDRVMSPYDGAPEYKPRKPD